MQHRRLRQRSLLLTLAACGAFVASAPLVAAEPALEPIVVGTPTRIEVFPTSVKLDGSRRRMQLVVTGHYADGRQQDLTRAATFVSNNSQIATVAGGLTTPVANGTAEVTVSAGGREQKVAVIVAGQDTPAQEPLRYGAMVALTKQGCNGGACHGSPTGKGGFRLSLLGFDPVLDELTLVRQSFGRRTNVFEPERSLLLQKPLMQVSHGGGQKLRPTDPAYDVLRNWIASGCHADPANSPVCQKIEVYPPQRQLHWPAHTQQLAVLAHFSDGSVRDVTPLAVYTSSADTVASVTPGGMVVAHERGESVVVVRYLEELATASLTFLREVDGFRWPEPPQFNYIDKLVDEKLRLLQIVPSSLCSDGQFIRRVYLDVIGALPAPAEVQAFVTDASPDKRKLLIDQLLSRSEYAEFWALKWGDLLRIKGSKVTASGVHKFHRWLLEAVRDNMPYDQFASALITAEGSTLDNPPANYYRTGATTSDCAESTSQLFLGIRIQCAKCHNHPHDRWSQNNYYGISAFFTRVQRKETNVADELLVWMAQAGDTIQPQTKQIVRPWLPLAGEIDVPAGTDPRRLFADWLAKSDNPLFAKVGVNRIWGHLVGRGIVDPVDDFRESNPPTIPKLLDALAADFVAHGYDQKHIIRTILNSRTYQLDSQALPLNRTDDKYFSHARARLLSAEQLLDAVCNVTGVPEKYPGLPAGTRATQLPGPDSSSDFLKVFGQPARESVCDCERSSTPKLTQALQLINGPLLGQKLADRRGRLAKQLRDGVDPRQLAGTPPVSGRVLWLSADEGALAVEQSQAADGQGVAVWRDRSGEGRDVLQPDAARQPTYVASSINGLPALKFDGQDDWLHNTATNLLPSGAPRTVLVVGQSNPAGNGGAIFAFRRTTAGRNSIFSAQLGVVAGTNYVYSDGLRAPGNSSVPLAVVETVRKPFVAVYLSAGAGKKLAVHLNGEPLAVAQEGAVGDDDGATGFTVGNREDVANYSWNGELSEVLVYEGALTPEQLAAAGTYLATKYGLESKYPAAKPTAPQPAGKTDRQIITEWYLAALARTPAEDELVAAEQHIALIGDRRQGLEDFCWALLNSKEFLFQH